MTKNSINVNHMGNGGIKLRNAAVRHRILMNTIIEENKNVNVDIKIFKGEYYMVFDTKEIAMEMKLRYF